MNAALLKIDVAFNRNAILCVWLCAGWLAAVGHQRPNHGGMDLVHEIRSLTKVC